MSILFKNALNFQFVYLLSNLNFFCSTLWNAHFCCSFPLKRFYQIFANSLDSKINFSLARKFCHIEFANILHFGSFSLSKLIEGPSSPWMNHPNRCTTIFCLFQLFLSMKTIIRISRIWMQKNVQQCVYAYDPSSLFAYYRDNEKNSILVEVAMLAALFIAIK